MEIKRIPFAVGPYTVHLRTLLSHKRTTIILVHGLGVSSDYYVKFAQHLAPFYNVIMIDLPGYGKTPKPEKPLTIPQLAEILNTYITISQLTDVVAVGQSMGCQIVAHAARLSPDLFKKIVLLSPTTNNKERSVLIQSFRLFQDTFHEPLQINLIVFKNYLRMGIRRFIITSKFMVLHRIEHALTHVSIPVLLVGGSRDKIVPKRWLKHLVALTPNARAVEMPTAPHLLQYTHPEELTAITKGFIDA